MQGKIIGVSISISRKGELNFFQVNIPIDVKMVTGVLAEIVGFSVAPDLHKRTLAGTLKLQAEQTSGICYSCQLFTGYNTIGDILKVSYSGSDVAELYPAFRASTFRGFQPVRIPNGYVLTGSFEDNIGRELNQDISYKVNLHLQTETD